MAEIDKGLPNTRTKLDIPSEEEIAEEVAVQEPEEQKGPIEVIPEEDGGVTLDFEPGSINVPGTESHFDNLADILPIIRGGTGLDTTGSFGQILQVINNSGDLNWKHPTAYSPPIPCRILETLTGLYDNRTIKDYNLINPNIQLLNNSYEWTIISNYLPPTNTKQIIFNIEFSLYDINLNTSIKIEFLVNNTLITKQTSEEKFFSANQKKTIQKTFIVNLDGAYKDLDWISNNSVIVKITDTFNSGNVKLFTFDGSNVHHPKITVQSIGVEAATTTLETNIDIEGGAVTKTKIGIGVDNAEEAAFTSINMTGGNITNANDLNSTNVITNNINTTHLTSTNFISQDINSTNITSDNLTLNSPLSISNGGTGITTIGTSGQVLYVDSTGNSLEWKMIPQRSVQSNQILENLVGIYDNRTIKTYTLTEPTIQTLNNNYEWTRTTIVTTLHTMLVDHVILRACVRHCLPLLPSPSDMV